jgi:hypothetical protein
MTSCIIVPSSCPTYALPFCHLCLHESFQLVTPTWEAV